jgi:16S rRNA G966 N2-methylase RsmD
MPTPEEQQEAIKGFITKHARAYDPAHDDYDRPPFAADIKEGKNDPIYNAHSYHTKVPPRGIIPYILHYTAPGDLILDPFCGSGMTGMAAQMCASPPADLLEQFPELRNRVGSRACILNDLSPAACHIAYNYNTPVDVETLRCEFQRIKAAVQDEFDWLYGTEHYEPAVALYDPANPDVASRLMNPPAGASTSKLFGTEDRTWELITKAEVEKRLGYPVTELDRDEEWGSHDVSKVEDWVCLPAAVQYTIWSDVYRCEGLVTIEEPTGRISTRGKNEGRPIVTKKRVPRGCGRVIVLWDVAMDDNTGDLREVFRCPHCDAEWRKQSLSVSASVPVRVTIQFTTLQHRRALRTRRISHRELLRVEEISKAPRGPVPPGVDMAIDLGREMMRHGNLKRGLSHIRDFYTPRNLRALAVLWRLVGAVEDPRIMSALQFTLTSIINTSSRMRFYRPSGPGDVRKGTLYVASLTSESNVLEGWVSKVAEIMPVLASTAQRHPGVVVHRCGSATSFTEIPDVCVDYIFADPPFGSNIYYADCSLLWESWLGRLTDEDREMVVSDRRKNGSFKTLDDYGRMMRLAFEEMYRVLKPGRWATIEFNNSDGAVFEAIKTAVRSAGLARIIHEYERQESLRVLERQCSSNLSHDRRLSSVQPEYDTVCSLSRSF